MGGTGCQRQTLSILMIDLHVCQSLPVTVFRPLIFTYNLEMIVSTVGSRRTDEPWSSIRT